MKQILLLLTAFMFSATVFGQEIQWTPLKGQKADPARIVSLNGEEFFARRYAVLSYYKGLQQVAVAPINRVTPAGNGMIEGMSRIGEEVVVFISLVKDGTNTVYYQRYSKDCKPVGEMKELLSYACPKGLFTYDGTYRILGSANGEYVVVEYDFPWQKDKEQRYGYKVINKAMEVIASGEYGSRWENRNFRIVDRCLTKDGRYFFLAQVDKTDEEREEEGEKKIPRHSKVMILQAKNDDMDPMEVAIRNNDYVHEVSLFEDKGGNLRLNGLYGWDGNHPVGIFHMYIDFDRNQVIKKFYNEFAKDFFGSGDAYYKKKLSDEMQAKEKINGITIFHYGFSDLITTEDGSVIGVLEQYEIRFVPHDGGGFGSISYSAGDLIVYKIHPNGELQYTKRITKGSSGSTSFYLTSYAMYFAGDSLHLFFNDDKAARYDAAGNYNESTWRMYKHSLIKEQRITVVAEVIVDTQTGEMTRKAAFPGTTKPMAVAELKQWYTNYNAKSMLIYLRTGKKEQFGLLKF